MRTSVVREVGGQRDLAHTHDMEMWFRLARAADVGYVDRPRPGLAPGARRQPLGHGRRRPHRPAGAGRRLHHPASPTAWATPTRTPACSTIARTALAEEAVARVCQAYTRGWGGNATTDAYLDFARRQVADLDGLRHGLACAGAWRSARPARVSCRACSRRARLPARDRAPEPNWRLDRAVRRAAAPRCADIYRDRSRYAGGERGNRCVAHRQGGAHCAGRRSGRRRRTAHAQGGAPLRRRGRASAAAPADVADSQRLATPPAGPARPRGSALGSAGF